MDVEAFNPTCFKRILAIKSLASETKMNVVLHKLYSHTCFSNSVQEKIAITPEKLSNNNDK